MLLQCIYRIFIHHAPRVPRQPCSVNFDAVANNAKHVPKYRVQDKTKLGKCPLHKHFAKV